MPDIADGFGIDVAHAGIAGDVVTAHHHVTARIDVQPLENERTRHLVGVEIGGRIGGAPAIERCILAPGQEFAFDQVVHADIADPVLFDGIDVHSGLHDGGSNDFGAASALIAHRQHATRVLDQDVPFESFTYNGVG